MTDADFLAEIQKTFGIEVKSIADLAAHNLPARLDLPADTQGTTLPASLDELAATGVAVDCFVNKEVGTSAPNLEATVEATLEAELEAEIELEMELLLNPTGNALPVPYLDDSQVYHEDSLPLFPENDTMDIDSVDGCPLSKEELTQLSKEETPPPCTEGSQKVNQSDAGTTVNNHKGAFGVEANLSPELELEEPRKHNEQSHVSGVDKLEPQKLLEGGVNTQDTHGTEIRCEESNPTETQPQCADTQKTQADEAHGPSNQHHLENHTDALELGHIQKKAKRSDEIALEELKAKYQQMILEQATVMQELQRKHNEYEERNRAEVNAREQAEVKAKEQAEVKEREQAAVKAREQAEVKAREQAQVKEREQAAVKAREQAEVKEREQADVKAREKTAQELELLKKHQQDKDKQLAAAKQLLQQKQAQELLLVEREKAKELQLKRRRDDEKLFEEMKATERKRILEEEQKAKEAADMHATMKHEQERIREQQRLLAMQAKAREEVRLELLKQRQAEQQMSTLRGLMGNTTSSTGASSLAASKSNCHSAGTQKLDGAKKAEGITLQQKQEFIAAEVKRRLALQKQQHNQAVFSKLDVKCSDTDGSKNPPTTPVPSTPSTVFTEPTIRSRSEVFLLQCFKLCSFRS